MYYRRDLAFVHHRGFAFHAEACAPSIVELLSPLRAGNGSVLEIGCGSGLLTKELTAAGFRVTATDASGEMLELAREIAPDAQEIRRLVLPNDPLPAADAIVGCGHALNYLADLQAIYQALDGIAQSLRPGGILAIDICDLEWGRVREGLDNLGRVGEDWAIITRFSSPTPDRYVREMTTFVRNEDGSWRRDDERHENVLVDAAQVAAQLEKAGLRVEIRDSFGAEKFPVGLKAIVGSRPPT